MKLPKAQSDPRAFMCYLHGVCVARAQDKILDMKTRPEDYPGQNADRLMYARQWACSARRYYKEVILCDT